MEDEALSFGISTASTNYKWRAKSHFELCTDFEDVSDGDDELKTTYPCPFCSEDFDMLELWCHIDLEHPIEAKSGDLQGGHWQSFPAGSFPVISSSKTTRDPFLSFLYSASAADECENVQPDSSSDLNMEEENSDQADDCVLQRDVQPSLSDKDQIEKARRGEFIQGLLMSTILDPDF